MKTKLGTLLAMLSVLLNFAGYAADIPSLTVFPGPLPPGALQGLDGTEAKEGDGLLQLRRALPPQEKRPCRKFKLGFKAAPLPLDQAPPGAALRLQFRVAEGSPAGRYNLLTVLWQGPEKGQSFRSRLPFVDQADWQELIVPLPDQPFPLSSLTLLLREADYDFRAMFIARPRRLTATLTSDPHQALESFTVAGSTDSAEPVWLGLQDADGKLQYRQVQPANGRYSYTWDKPPLRPGASNPLRVRSGNGQAPDSVALPLDVFGYLPSYDFAWLKVQGDRIVTAADGKTFVPAGIGYARDVIIPAQDDHVMAFCKAHGLNTIRLAFYTRLFNGEAGRPIDIAEHIRNHLAPVVEAARRHGLYVILDDHEYFHQRVDEATARGKQASKIWEPAVVENWIRVWTRVAQTFRDDPIVLGYELQNEPYDMPAEQVRDFYTRCLQAIRQVDRKHIVLVGTRDWSHARALEDTWGSVAQTLDAPYHNVVFAFHDYPLDNHPWIVQQHVTAFRDRYRVPVMCTEFGATHWSHGETICREFQAGMLALFAKENIGWMVWALGLLEDNPRNPYNEVDKVGISPPRFDSCAYSDLWAPVARIMGTPFPAPPAPQP